MTAAPAPAPAAATPRPGGYPSPADWRDEVLYSVLLDRFDWAGVRQVEGDPADGDSRHGGNLAGLTRRLDYLHRLGVTALLLSPVTRTAPDSYHGYSPVALDEVDPRLGSLADLVELIAQAHRRGIRVVLDLVLNHAGPVFDYADGNGWKPAGPGEIERWNHPLRPAGLGRPEHFSRRGIIADWKDPEQASRGDFPPNLRRFATENPATRQQLIRLACWWIETADADGVRLDAIRHMDAEFVRQLCGALRRHAGGLGKRNFLVLGEYSATEDAPIAACLGTGIDTAFGYSEYRRQSWPLHAKAPAADLARSVTIARSAFGDRYEHLVRFIDNHDVYRFLRESEPESQLRPALAFLLLSAGIPMLYYGTEQAFRQPTDRLERECSADRAAPRNREDMFADGAFTSASSAGDRFDETSSTFRFARRLIALRRRHPALRVGSQRQRFAEESGPGLYVISRHHGQQGLLVAINTSASPAAAQLPLLHHEVGHPEFVDLLNPRVRVPVRDGSQTISLLAAGHQVLVLQSRPSSRHHHAAG
ncbi:MAG TPA: alpha-amylase family glycosyl hydrolase [Jatrophihabitans sp.]|nr:alpha-amylase family glycosyl hydrolase [Jatrophihabitans sp.]